MSTIVAHTDPDQTQTQTHTDAHRTTTGTDTCTPVWESRLDDPYDRRAERK